MKELELAIEKGGAEKKIIISSGVIRFDDHEHSINKRHNFSTIFLAGNGDYPPPFLKGSKVLRDIRESSGRSLDNWKRILSLQQHDSDYFKFELPDSESESSLVNSANWGVWICENTEDDSFPQIMILNFPLWTLSRAFKNQSINMDEYAAALSRTYRIVLSALTAVCTFQSSNGQTDAKSALALTDMGNNLIDKILISKLDTSEFLADEVYKLRIRIFTQVLSDWLGKNELFNKIIITYGDGIRMDLIERAWDLQVEDSKDEINEFSDALSLREKNVALLNQLKKSTGRINLKSTLELALDSFRMPFPSLSADLIQSRTIVEAISFELCDKFNLKVQSATLFSYVQRLEESKKISPWVTSYLHVIRQLGNEAAHYKMSMERRPEKPMGRDLIVIHAALNRILSFCIDEEL
jgi:hypothetical protein